MSDRERTQPIGGPRWLYWRLWVQIVAAYVANNGLVRGTRAICWPGLNCWACPWASFGCPIGALENSASALRWRLIAGSGLAAAAAGFTWYVAGGLILVGALVGRMVCGWLCPFGLFQELLNRITRFNARLPAWTSYFRYAVLAFLVFAIPYAVGEPWFCKLCPQGFLEAGIPQPLLRPELRAMIGWLWYTKLWIFLAFAIASVFVRRPFCALACPLGAIYALFQPIALLRSRYIRERCTDCMWCVRACPQGIDPRHEVGGHRCVSCLECHKCPFGAIILAPAWRARRLSTAAAAPGESQACDGVQGDDELQRRQD